MTPSSRAVLLLTSLLSVAAVCGPADPSATTAGPGEPDPGVTSTPPPPEVRTAEGIEDDVIGLGALLPLEGPGARLGTSMAAGQRLYWAHVNRDLGGVGGRFPVELDVRDHGLEEERALAELEGMAGRLLAVSSLLGPALTRAVAGRAAELRLPIMAGAQASSWAGLVEQGGVLLLDRGTDTHRDQVANGALWAAERADPPLLGPGAGAALVRQDDPHGEDCLAGYEAALGALAFEDSARAVVTAGTAAERVAELRASGAEVVFLCALPPASPAFLEAADAAGWDPVVMASPLSDPGGPLRPDYVVGLLPGFGDPTPGMLLLRRNLERHGEELGIAGPDAALYLGYSQAATLHAVLEEALAGGDLTREGVLAAAAGLGELDLGFGFGPLAARGPRPSAVHLPEGQGLGLRRVSDYLVAPAP